MEGATNKIIDCIKYILASKHKISTAKGSTVVIEALMYLQQLTQKLDLNDQLDVPVWSICQFLTQRLAWELLFKQTWSQNVAVRTKLDVFFSFDGQIVNNYVTAMTSYDALSADQKSIDSATVSHC